MEAPDSLRSFWRWRGGEGEWRGGRGGEGEWRGGEGRGGEGEWSGGEGRGGEGRGRGGGGEGRGRRGEGRGGEGRGRRGEGEERGGRGGEAKGESQDSTIEIAKSPEDDFVEYAMEVKTAELIKDLVCSQGEVVCVLPMQETKVSDALVEHLQGVDVLIFKTGVSTL